MTLNIILNLLELKRKEKEMRQLLDSKNQLELVKLLMTLKNSMLRNLVQLRKTHLLKRKLILSFKRIVKKLQLNKVSKTNSKRINLIYLNQMLRKNLQQLEKILELKLNVLKVNSKNHLTTLRKTLKSYLVGDK